MRRPWPALGRIAIEKRYIVATKSDHEVVTPAVYNKI